MVLPISSAMEVTPLSMLICLLINAMSNVGPVSQ